ncbi:M48 family metallopeptidase [Candidatus Woesearchaeota archaeon]|nr:M48 family metallopeptidase [Candidatus Woesearchaeota archaeon]
MMRYKDVMYSLKKSNRKTVSIYVERDLSVTILTPKELETNQINNIIDLKRYWIHKSISELKDLNQSKVKRSLVDGEGYLYLGKTYRLKIRNDLDLPLKIAENYFFINTKNIKDYKKYFINFYKKNGEEIAKDRLRYYQKKMGLKINSFKIIDLQNRWASVSNKSLNFHWKIFMAPLSIIDYVIVHELTHLKIPNHNKEFWAEVENVLPDFYNKKEWLKKNGANLDI